MSEGELLPNLESLIKDEKLLESFELIIENVGLFIACLTY